MEITEVKVFPVPEEKLRAFVSIVIDGCFMVNDIKVIRGREGLFISMPSRRKKSGEFKDVAHPLNNDTRQKIEARILDEYERVLAERGLERETRGAARIQSGAVRPQVEPKVLEPVAVPAPAARSKDRADSVAELEDEGPTVDEKSLEEVAELHLRDSFWSVS